MNQDFDIWVFVSKLEHSGVPVQSLVQIRRSWDGGPLRNWSDRKTTLTPMSHNRGGFVGAYVCERGLGSCDGAYLVREEQSWLCGACESRGRNQVGPAGQVAPGAGRAGYIRTAPWLTKPECGDDF